MTENYSKDFIADFIAKYPQFKEVLQMPTRAGELKYIRNWEGCSMKELTKTFGSQNLCVSLKDLESILKNLGK